MQVVQRLAHGLVALLPVDLLEVRLHRPVALEVGERPDRAHRLRLGADLARSSRQWPVRTCTHSSWSRTSPTRPCGDGPCLPYWLNGGSRSHSHIPAARSSPTTSPSRISVVVRARDTVSRTDRRPWGQFTDERGERGGDHVGAGYPLRGVRRTRWFGGGRQVQGERVGRARRSGGESSPSASSVKTWAGPACGPARKASSALITAPVSLVVVDAGVGCAGRRGPAYPTGPGTGCRVRQGGSFLA